MTSCSIQSFLSCWPTSDAKCWISTTSRLSGTIFFCNFVTLLCNSFTLIFLVRLVYQLFSSAPKWLNPLSFWRTFFNCSSLVLVARDTRQRLFPRVTTCSIQNVLKTAIGSIVPPFVLAIIDYKRTWASSNLSFSFYVIFLQGLVSPHRSSKSVKGTQIPRKIQGERA